MTVITYIAMGVGLFFGLGGVAFVLWYNRPLPRRRKYRDARDDEHAQWRFI